MRRATVILLLALGCSSEGDVSFAVRESVAQLQVTHVMPGALVELLGPDGQVVASGTADELGSLMLRGLAPGDGYVVQSGGERSRELTVMSVEESQPGPELYRSQTLLPGHNYITTRDGTTLSAYVTLPGPLGMGPYPTVVDYSGYAVSQPGTTIDEAAFLCDRLPILCDAPNDAAAMVAGLFGYATVSVNVRGTGCSGGAFDYFEELQVLDGYDAIETIAAQPWVLHNKVGMVGLSYPGISQLFVAALRPPSLAAIAPMSVIGNAQTTILPGGILNDGFAIEWVESVLKGAKPYGQGWEKAQVDGGDEQCAENQLLHGQLIDNVEQARNTAFYDPTLHDRLNPTTFVDRISVPVFLSGQWQDEQTGPYFFTMLDRFTSAPALRVVVKNGVHVDGFAPDEVAEWRDFLELFVARRLPVDNALVRGISPLLFQGIFQSSMVLGTTKWDAYSDYDQALADWKAQPALEAQFESGAGLAADPGAPIPTFTRELTAWPPPETRPRRWYFQPDGTLGDAPPPAVESASTFTLDPGAGARGILAPGGNVWDKLPHYDWEQPGPGKAVVFESAPLAEDLVMLGSGSVDLWIRANVDDADLQVSLSEVRPDGQEMYVQSGWLRASLRGLGPESTELWPAPTYQEKDWAPLAPGEWTAVRVGIPGFQQVFRAGSRIRVSVDTPGASRAAWRFHLKTFPIAAEYAVGHDVARPSSVVLPILEGVTAPSPLPPCPSLRAQQCRAWQPYENARAH